MLKSAYINKKLSILIFSLLFARVFAVQLDVTPTEVIPDAVTPSTFVLSFSNSILDVSNSGINVVKITIPDSFEFVADPLENRIVVSNYVGTTLTALSSTAYDANALSTTWMADDEVMVSTNGDKEISLILGSQVSNRSEGEQYEQFYVQLDLLVPVEFDAETFSARVDAVQFNGMTNASGKLDRYATTGEMKVPDEPSVSRLLAPAEGFASLIPSEINQGSANYEFTLRVRATDLANRQNIETVAVLVPDSLASMTLSNFASEVLGNDASANVTFPTYIDGFTNSLGNSNLMLIDYSSSPILSPESLDVLYFTAYGTPTLGTNVDWKVWVDGSTVDQNSILAATNSVYPNQLLTVYEENTVSTWDFEIRKVVNKAPVYYGTESEIGMSYVNIIRDGEDGSEELTALTVAMAGSSPDALGLLRLYKESFNEDDFDNTEDTLIDTVPFGPANITNSFSFSESGISSDTESPEKYWVSLEITNTDEGVYSNNLGMRLISVAGTGPNGGVIENESRFTAASSAIGKVDKLEIDISSSSSTNTNILVRVKQGFESDGFSLIFNNSDIDATNYLRSIIVSNYGSADNGDLQSVFFFQDNGNGYYDVSDDLMMSGSFGSDKTATAQALVPKELSGTNSIIWWVKYNTRTSGAIGKTVDLRITGPEGLEFIDYYEADQLFSGQYDAVPLVNASSPVLSSNATQVITPLQSRDYDFNLSAINYSDLPGALQQNDYAPMASFYLSMDVENTNGGDYASVNMPAQVLESIDIKINQSGHPEQSSGLVYLYRENSGNESFNPQSPSDDELIASFPIDYASNFSFPLNFSNVSKFTDGQDVYHLVYRLTNAIELAMTNTLSMQITNFQVSGPDGGIVSGASFLSAAPAFQSRMDKLDMQLTTLVNDAQPPEPTVSSFNNKLLRLELAGEDPDARYYFRSLAVRTNDLTSMPDPDSDITSVKVLDSSDKILGQANLVNGVADISFSTPFTAYSNEAYTFYIAYDVSYGNNVLNRDFGLEITNGSIGFSDEIEDSLDQIAGISSVYNGPSTKTNVTFGPFSAILWDLRVIDSAVPQSEALSRNTEGLLYSMDLISDKNEPETAVALSNIWVNIQASNFDSSGELRLYRETDGNTLNLDVNNDTYVTNVYFTSDNTNDLQFSFYQDAINNEESSGQTFSRFYITAILTNENVDAFDDVFRLEVTNILAKGRDAFVADLFNLSNAAPYYTRYDAYELSSYLHTNSDLEVRQGNFNNFSHGLILSNIDPDASYSLKSLRVTNRGNSDDDDLSFLRIYSDNGDGVFNATNDNFLNLASLSANNSYSVNLNPALTIDQEETVLWFTFDVELNAAVSNTVELYTLDGSSLFTFNDDLDSSSALPLTQLPQMDTSLQYSSWVPKTNIITSFLQQPFDLSLVSVDYSDTPIAITTNKPASFGYVEFYRDVDVQDIVFNGLEVLVNESGTAGGVNGLLSLYKEISNASWKQTDDELISQIDVSSPGGYTLNAFVTNTISLSPIFPDKYYVVFEATNDIEEAKNSSVQFSITNILFEGKDNVFTNLDLLAGQESAESRIDDFAVEVLSIENDRSVYSVKSDDKKVAYLKVQLRGSDIQGTNSLSSILLNTNTLSTLGAESLDAIVVSTNKSGDDILTTVLANASFDINGTLLEFEPNPFKIVGTNIKTLYIGFTPNPDEDKSVGKKAGLTLPQGAFTFTDIFNDNHEQNSFIKGLSSGPSSETNIEIIPSSTEVYDFRIESADMNLAPVSISSNQRALLSKFEMTMDNDIQVLSIDAVDVLVNSSRNPAQVQGLLSIYRDSANLGSFDDGDLLLTNIAVDGLSSVSLPLNLTNISTDFRNPDRFFLTFELTNALSDAKDSTIGFQITNMQFSGRDNLIQELDLLTNYSGSEFRIDDYSVSVNFVSNDFVDTSIKANASKVSYLHFQLEGQDPDGTNYLKSISVFTNGLSTLESNSLSSILWGSSKSTAAKIGNVVKQVEFNIDESLLDLDTLALAIPASEAYDIYIGYEFNPNEEEIIGQRVGLELRSNSLVFYDNFSDSLEQKGFLSSSIAGPLVMSNQRIIPSTAKAWDFSISDINYSAFPSRFTTNQEVTVGYIDLYADVDVDPISIQGFDVNVLANASGSDIKGLVNIYRDTNFNQSYDINDENVASIEVDGDSLYNMDFALSNISTDEEKQERFFLRFEATNDILDAQDVVMAIQVSNIRIDGSDQVVENLTDLTNSQSKYSRIDNLAVVIKTNMHVISEPWVKALKQRVTHQQLILHGLDEDSTNYISSITISTNDLAVMSNDSLSIIHIGTDTNADGNLKISSILKQSEFNIDGTEVSFVGTPIALPGTNEVRLFIAYDHGIDEENIVGDRIGLMTKADAFQFVDIDSDGVDQTGFLQTTAVGPAVAETVEIIYNESQTWDYSLESLDYSISPVSFTSNQTAPFLSFELLRDLDLSNISVTALHGRTISSASPDAIAGEIALYEEVSGDDTFSASEDLFITNTFAEANESFTLNVQLTNISNIRADQASRFYLSYRLTNDISLSLESTFSLQLTNLSTIGRDNLVNNISDLSASGSESRVDDYRVDIVSLTNERSFFTVKQFSVEEPAIWLSLRGRDPDAVNYLSSVLLTTNQNSELFENTLTSVIMGTNLYTNSGDVKVSKLFIGDYSSGQANISFPDTPIVLNGTNTKNIYIGFSMNAVSNQVGKEFGLVVASNGFGYVDKYNDGLNQKAFTLDDSYGPTGTSNFLIISQDIALFDLLLNRVSYYSHDEILKNVETPLVALEITRDNEGDEDLTGIVMEEFNSQSGKYYQGYFNVYTNNALASDLFLSNEKIVSAVPFSHTNQQVSLDVSGLISPLVKSDNSPRKARVVVTYVMTNFSPDVEHLLKISDLTHTGPDLGKGKLIAIENYEDLDVNPTYVLNDQTLNQIEIDANEPFSIRQQAKKPVLALHIANEDPDADYTLQSLTFRLSDTEFETSEYKAQLFSDIDGESELSGETRFTGGKARVVLSSPIQVGPVTNSIYLFIAVGDEAKPGNKIQVSLNTEDQSNDVSMDKYSPYWNSEELTIPISVSNFTSKEIRIESGVAFNNNPVVVANTIINPCDGDYMAIYLEDLENINLYTARIYDSFGYLVKEIPVSDTLLYWEGDGRNGETVSTGMYRVVLSGPEYDSGSRDNSVKVVVKKCD